MLSVTLVIRGTSITDLKPNFSISSGTICSLYCCCNRAMLYTSRVLI